MLVLAETSPMMGDEALDLIKPQPVVLPCAAIANLRGPFIYSALGGVTYPLAKRALVTAPCIGRWVDLVFTPLSAQYFSVERSGFAVALVHIDSPNDTMALPKGNGRSIALGSSLTLRSSSGCSPRGI
jgi:hypothetical protein